MFFQTLSAKDTNSSSSSQCALCRPHYTIQLFAVIKFLQFHHSNSTLISAALLMLPTILDRSYFFVSDVQQRSQWRDFVVSGCQRSELQCVPSVLPDSSSSVKLLEF